MKAIKKEPGKNPEHRIENLLKDGKAFRIDSETFINISKIRDTNEAIVQFKGNIRDVVSIYLFAGAQIMEQLIKDGQDPEYVKEVMTGGIVSAADTAIKKAAAVEEDKNQEGEKEE